ncbi:MAG TPA: UbiA prenyltransferase family protein [Acidimicrobiia bacterium]|jgi:4-hydroxybenzoate polyprenyltransferase|nr:UbiA prenyltransferase family protein [Acidimicrobiia bacterium]
MKLRTPDPDAAAVLSPAPISRWRAHVRICRIDHWFKNVFVFPGVVVAIGIVPNIDESGIWWRLIVALAAVCLVASSNYVINELMDAPFDVHHPTKRFRPVPSGQVIIPLAYVQWIVLMLAGLGLGALVTWKLVLTLLALWIMGCLYNLPPIRTKDHAYLDVLSEAVNNPLRMLVGWYVVTSTVVPPLSLLVSYWMIGCYFMAAKRFAEYNDFQRAGDDAARYRASFAHYTSERLLVSIMFYASAAMLFFGAFIVRYRLELIVSFPLIAVFMAMYLHLALKPDSPVENPEKLYRERALMLVLAACVVVMTVLLLVDLPFLDDWFSPTVHAVSVIV